MRNRSLLVSILLVAWVTTGCDDVKSVASYLQAQVGEYYHIARTDDWNEESIPQASVEYAGEVGVKLKRTVELVFDTEAPGIGEIGWMGITPDSSLLLTDRVSREAHEFSLNDGRYIRSFGRQGKGPGEYGNADSMVLDSKGSIYIQDGIYGQLLRYNRQGQYLGHKMRWISGVDLLVNREDEFLLMEKKYGLFLQIRRVTGLNGEIKYTLPLFSKKEEIVTCFMSNPAQLSYNTTSDHLYYLELNDYMVKEINASTGEVLRRFGIMVPSYNALRLEKQMSSNFAFLPEKYHDLDCGSLDLEELTYLISDIGQATSMELLEDRYLLISHSLPDVRSINVWTLYDLTPPGSSTMIKAYSLNSVAYQSLNGTKKNSQGGVIQASSIDGRITSWQNQLYVYKPPSVERAEVSNGVVEVYEVSID